MNQKTTNTCHIVECCQHSDCIIIELLKRQPKSFDSCSYAKTQTQHEKIVNKRSQRVELKGFKRFKKSKTLKKEVNS
jgi:hypothetical protein